MASAAGRRDQHACDRNDGQIVANFTDTLTLAAAISGTGTLSKAGAGTLTLTGNSSYTGATTVNAGTLSVNGSIASSASPSTAGGTIGGNGIIGNTTINSGGTLCARQLDRHPHRAGQPGVRRRPRPISSRSRRRLPTAPTSLGTATPRRHRAGGVRVGSLHPRTYTILSAAGGSTGTFSSLTTSGLPAGFAAALSYTGNRHDLEPHRQLARSSAIGTGGLSVNQRNVATALDNFFNNGGALPPGFVSVFGLTGSNLGNALSQLSGEAATGGQQGAFQMGNQFSE